MTSGELRGPDWVDANAATLRDLHEADQAHAWSAEGVDFLLAQWEHHDNVMAFEGRVCATGCVPLRVVRYLEFKSDHELRLLVSEAVRRLRYGR